MSCRNVCSFQVSQGIGQLLRPGVGAGVCFTGYRLDKRRYVGRIVLMAGVQIYELLGNVAPDRLETDPGNESNDS